MRGADCERSEPLSAGRLLPGAAVGVTQTGRALCRCSPSRRSAQGNRGGPLVAARSGPPALSVSAKPLCEVPSPPEELCKARMSRARPGCPPAAPGCAHRCAVMLRRAPHPPPCSSPPCPAVPVCFYPPEAALIHSVLLCCRDNPFCEQSSRSRVLTFWKQLSRAGPSLPRTGNKYLVQLLLRGDSGAEFCGSQWEQL